MRFLDFLFTGSLGLVPVVHANSLHDAPNERDTSPVCGVAGLKVKVPFAVSIAAADTTPLG